MLLCADLMSPQRARVALDPNAHVRARAADTYGHEHNCMQLSTGQARACIRCLLKTSMQRSLTLCTILIISTHSPPSSEALGRIKRERDEPARGITMLYLPQPIAYHEVVPRLYNMQCWYNWAMDTVVCSHISQHVLPDFAHVATLGHVYYDGATQGAVPGPRTKQQSLRFRFATQLLISHSL